MSLLGAGGGSASLLIHQIICRNSRLRIFPEAVLGTTSTKCTSRGRLYRVKRSATNILNSSSIFLPEENPSRSATNATGISPASASGLPTTPHSRTAGCSSSTASTSAGATGNPLYLIISLRRSTTRKNPSASRVTISPDQYQPSRNTAAVASGSFQ